MPGLQIVGGDLASSPLRPARMRQVARLAWALRTRKLSTRCAASMLVFVVLLAPLSTFAQTSPADMLADPVLEARARTLGRTIRCMVCQNQSIEDSEASLARDLRLLVRERISAGDSDAEVRSFLHARYGDFVLLRPPFAWNTLVLWATPPLALLVGFGLIALTRRGMTQAAPPTPLSTEEQRRLAAIEADIQTRGRNET